MLHTSIYIKTYKIHYLFYTANIIFHILFMSAPPPPPSYIYLIPNSNILCTYVYYTCLYTTMKMRFALFYLLYIFMEHNTRTI